MTTLRHSFILGTKVMWNWANVPLGYIPTMAAALSWPPLPQRIGTHIGRAPRANRRSPPRAQGRRPAGSAPPTPPAMRTPWPSSGERVPGLYARCAGDRSTDRSWSLTCAVAIDAAMSLISSSSPGTSYPVHPTTAARRAVEAKSTTIGMLSSRFGPAEVPVRQGPLSQR